MVWKTIPQAEIDGDIPDTMEFIGGGVTWTADGRLLVNNNGDPTFYANATFQWPIGTWLDQEYPRFRVTCISYQASSIGVGAIYSASGWFAQPEGDPPGAVFIPNEAPPGDGNPATSEEVDQWTPTPFELRPYNEGGNTPTFTYGTGDSTLGGDATPFIENSEFLIEVWVEDGPPSTSYNCACDDENNNETLGQLRDKMMHLLGWGATAANPPPGVSQMLTYWLQDAQAMLYRRFSQLRTERFFSWPLVQGVRMYDLPDNQETCTKKLDPRKLTWVGTERDGVWLPLISSIPPELYSYNTTGRPVRYEIRQCIEVWPTPDATNGNLIIKGHFGLERFTEDGDKTTIDSLPVFQVAIANAKAHYRQPDANNYIQQMEALIRDLTAGLHGTRRYIPGRRADEDYVYVEPRPTVPFPTS